MLNSSSPLDEYQWYSNVGMSGLDLKNILNQIDDEELKNIKINIVDSFGDEFSKLYKIIYNTRKSKLSLTLSED